ncbi:sensor histidine kinase [Micromonospora echinofusca]|uniref:sensor histidine kinase n=1 Tax=Micromonospora echinofusca TaxID=47858 RepID=UPI001AD70310|nr:HAMP domain-containing sensor histidine kinase [Micromonospora echinofusca]
MNRLPLRRSLLWGMVLLTAAALLVAGVTAALGLRDYLLDRTDDQLRSAAVLVRQRTGPVFTDPAQTLRTVVAPSEYVVEIRRDDGRSVRLGGPAGSLLDQAPVPPPDGRTSPVVTVGDGAYRAVTLRSRDTTVLIALPLAPVRQTVQRLILVELVTGTVVLLLLGLFARLLLVRGLRPLDRITGTATAIAAGDLDRRVPVDHDRAPDVRTEVGRLTLAVNGMLARLQTAMAARARSEQQLRDFVADASHELRTPLTSIRGYLHLLRQGMVDADRRPDVLRRTDEEATRMSALVDDLLYLARLDAEPALRHGPVDLAVVVRESLADALAVQPGRPATLTAPDTCPVTGDGDALRQVMANLLGNVRAHTPPDSPVTVTVSTADGRVQVSVADRGPGMAPELAERAFDRFTRADPGRSGGGSGLGLAIVAGIVAAHDGQVRLRTAPGAGTTVTFTLPTADS